MWSQPHWQRTTKLGRLALGLGSYRFAALCPDDDLVDLRVLGVCKNIQTWHALMPRTTADDFPANFWNQFLLELSS
eukprot:16436346-Heterocapsa_arctica.AAC.1